MATKPFRRFADFLHADATAIGPFPTWSPRDTNRLLGQDVAQFTLFLQTAARSSFGDGAFRPLPPEKMVPWNADDGWHTAWPQWRDRIVVFASDWRGRLFGFDKACMKEGEPVIAMIDPGSAELFQTESNFASFLDEEIVDFADEVISVSLYREWVQAGNARPLPSECVGYDQPLFLGGVDEMSNMALTDLEVYVNLLGQLSEQTAHLPVGAPVGGFTIG